MNEGSAVSPRFLLVAGSISSTTLLLSLAQITVSPVTTPLINPIFDQQSERSGKRKRSSGVLYIREYIRALPLVPQNEAYCTNKDERPFVESTASKCMSMQPETLLKTEPEAEPTEAATKPTETKEKTSGG